MRPDFAHVDTWIFDLDRTLYPPEADLFGQMFPRMARYLMVELGVDEVEAVRLRDLYDQEHGTLLAGLVAVHGVEPMRYLDEVHDIDLSGLAPDPGLAAAIRALPGRRIVFTNGPRHYAENVVAALGLGSAFDALYGVDDAGMVSKPALAAFEAIRAADGFDPARGAMFEDVARNLAVPRMWGMRTVLVGPNAAPGGDAEYATADLSGFLCALVAKAAKAS